VSLSLAYHLYWKERGPIFIFSNLQLGFKDPHKIG